MHRRVFVASSLSIGLAGCRHRLHREATRLNVVTLRASSELTHDVRLADERTRALVQKQLEAISDAAVTEAILRGAGVFGRPRLRFDFRPEGAEAPSDGELAIVAKSVSVGERGGFVDVDVRARVTLTSVHAGVLHEFDQSAHSRGGLDLRTASHGIWLASADAGPLATKTLPAFNDLSKEVTGLCHWTAQRAIERVRDDISG